MEPPGCHGVTFLPFINGERTPNWPQATGSVLGGCTDFEIVMWLVRAPVWWDSQQPMMAWHAMAMGSSGSCWHAWPCHGMPCHDEWAKSMPMWGCHQGHAMPCHALSCPGMPCSTMLGHALPLTCFGHAMHCRACACHAQGSACHAMLQANPALPCHILPMDVYARRSFPQAL